MNLEKDEITTGEEIDPDGKEKEGEAAGPQAGQAPVEQGGGESAGGEGGQNQQTLEF